MRDTVGKSVAPTSVRFNAIQHTSATEPQLLLNRVRIQRGGLEDQCTYPSTRVINYEYDGIGRLSAIKDGTTTLANGFQYTDGQQLSQYSQANGVNVVKTYTTKLQLDSVRFTKSGTDIFKNTYGYANNGQITSITDNVDSTRTVNFTYDALKRVSSATYPNASPSSFTINWVYDRYGNRTSQSGGPPNLAGVVDASTNRFTSIGGSGTAYDSNGNMTTDPSGAGYSYAWDAENRMVSVNSGTATYTYDPQSLRTQRAYGGTTYTTIYDGMAELAEYSGSSLSTEHVYGPDGKFAKFEGGTLKYFVTDHLSRRDLLNTSGDPVSSAAQGHYPFGEDWYGDSTEQFTSYERDVETENDYAIYRFYSNRQGRFLSPDPYAGAISLDDPQTLNRYAYVLNDPIDLLDPDGLECYNFYILRVNVTTGQIVSIDFRGKKCFKDKSSRELNGVSLPDPPKPPGPPPPLVCQGKGRSLEGNAKLINKPGAFGPTVPVQAGTAAIIPRQFGFKSDRGESQRRLRPFLGQISGTIGNQRFQGVTDVIGGAPPKGCRANVRDCLMRQNPGNLVVEVPKGKDTGKNAPATLNMPIELGCPSNTTEVKK